MQTSFKELYEMQLDGKTVLESSSTCLSALKGEGWIHILVTRTMMSVSVLVFRPHTILGQFPHCSFEDTFSSFSRIEIPRSIFRMLRYDNEDLKFFLIIFVYEKQTIYERKTVLSLCFTLNYQSWYYQTQFSQYSILFYILLISLIYNYLRYLECYFVNCNSLTQLMN